MTDQDPAVAGDGAAMRQRDELLVAMNWIASAADVPMDFPNLAVRMRQIAARANEAIEDCRPERGGQVSEHPAERVAEGLKAALDRQEVLMDEFERDPNRPGLMADVEAANAECRRWMAQAREWVEDPGPVEEWT